MSPEAHINALRAAMRVAFSVAVLSGCSSAEPEQTAANDSNLDTTNADVGNVENASANDPECVAKINDAMEHATEFPVGLDPEASACCTKAIAHPWHGDLGHIAYRCCNAFNASIGEENGTFYSQMACSPWGPPVPPPMTGGKPNRKRLLA